MPNDISAQNASDTAALSSSLRTWLRPAVFADSAGGGLRRSASASLRPSDEDSVTPGTWHRAPADCAVELLQWARPAASLLTSAWKNYRHGNFPVNSRRVNTRPSAYGSTGPFPCISELRRKAIIGNYRPLRPTYLQFRGQSLMPCHAMTHEPSLGTAQLAASINGSK